MKNFNKKLGSALLIGALTLGTFSIASANSFQGQNRQFRNNTPGVNQRVPREDIIKALDAKDYDAFLAAHKDQPVFLENMDQDKFNQLLEVHKYMTNGDIEKAQELRAELGLRQGNRGDHKPQSQRRNNPEALKALQSHDYQAFVEAHEGDTRFAEHMTEDRFQSMIERHEARFPQE